MKPPTSGDAILTVTRQFDDGYRDTHQHRWPNSTAKHACDRRWANLRGAGANTTRNGLTITVHATVGRLPYTETLQFEEDVS